MGKRGRSDLGVREADPTAGAAPSGYDDRKEARRVRSEGQNAVGNQQSKRPAHSVVKFRAPFPRGFTSLPARISAADPSLYLEGWSRLRHFGEDIRVQNNHSTGQAADRFAGELRKLHTSERLKDTPNGHSEIRLSCIEGIGHNVPQFLFKITPCRFGAPAQQLNCALLQAGDGDLSMP